MPNEILIKEGTRISFGVTGSFSPTDVATDYTSGSITDLITLAGVTNGTARQSDKVDLGATRALNYALMAAVELQATPTVGNAIQFFWAPSTHGTAANGNVFGNSGLDGTCPAGALGSVSLDEFLLFCDHIGSIRVSDDAVVQCGYVGMFTPPTRYGQLIVVNNSGATIAADDVENNCVLIPLIDEVQ